MYTTKTGKLWPRISGNLREFRDKLHENRREIIAKRAAGSEKEQKVQGGNLKKKANKLLEKSQLGDGKKECVYLG